MAVEPAVSYPLLSKLKLQAILRRMERLLVSDHFSADILRQVGRKLPIEVIGDPCLSLCSQEPLPEEVQALGRLSGRGASATLGTCSELAQLDCPSPGRARRDVRGCRAFCSRLNQAGR